ncbi:MAG: PP-loop domain-containing protein [Candidatus Magnetoglobus multicellularis str. Araruama]|uniref:PP-loop domain-containing protein n=1 Tax=Candidatus Magnetoglobus multicellularis str. Araruama TaxID=890399 RepID=A0A1V1P1K9_9BACT|nr:MAG: PP-loop domain-containing protein [Candidatus Magnetoglobus multicellularis str. Araruama]
MSGQSLIIQRKARQLKNILHKRNPLIVAFSGGIDSSYLLIMAVETIGKDNVIAVTARAPFFSPFETRHIEPLIHLASVKHIVVEHHAMTQDVFKSNPPDRCYHCKKMIFSTLRNIADSHKIRHIAHGANTDDLNDYRPGSLAAQEFEIEAPLMDAGLSKFEIRYLAKDYGLSNWNQAAMACLATRIPFHSPITLEKLDMIHRAEVILDNMGFQGARVRLIDRMAKIEIVKNQLSHFFSGTYQTDLYKQLRCIGFENMIVDKEGYKTRL